MLAHKPGEYGVDAAFMSLKRHGWDIHALSSGTGGARLTARRPLVVEDGHQHLVVPAPVPLAQTVTI
jgi:hypothetical protein